MLLIKIGNNFRLFSFFLLQSNKTYYELETSRNHQKKNEWEKGGLIKVDGNDDNEEITI